MAVIGATVRGGAIHSLGWRIVSAGTGALGSFVATAAAARILSATAFSGMLLVMGALYVGPIAIRLGLGNNTIRSLAGALSTGSDVTAANLLSGIVRTAAILAATLALPVAVLILGAARFDLLGDSILLGVVLFFEAVRLTASDVLTGLHRIAWSVALSFQSRSAVVGAIFLALAIAGARLSLTTTLLVLLGVNGVLALVSWLLLRRVLVAFPHRQGDTSARVRSILSASLAFFVADVGLFLIARGDIWFASRLLRPGIAAQYGASSTLASQLILPVSVAGLTLAPLAAGLAGQDRRETLEHLTRILATVAFVVTFVGGAALALFGAHILQFAYGSGFGGGATTLVVLTTGTIAAAVTGPAGWILAMTGLQSVAMRIVAAWAAIALIALPIGALAGGGIGLAICSSAMTAGSSAHMLVGCRRVARINSAPYARLRAALSAWKALSGSEARVTSDEPTLSNA